MSGDPAPSSIDALLPGITMCSPFDDDDPADLDEEFAPGDDTADVEATVQCPYCSEVIDIALDPGGGPVQRYVEDCHVCCRPWELRVVYEDDGRADVTVTPLDD